MSNYTRTIPVSLLATDDSKTLNAQIVDTLGDPVGEAITTGFVKKGTAEWMLTFSCAADTRGMLWVYEEGHAETYLGNGYAINPEVDVDGKTVEEALRIIAAVLAGKVTGAGTGTETFKGLDGVTDRVEVTVDTAGNRSAVDYDP